MESTWTPSRGIVPWALLISLSTTPCFAISVLGDPSGDTFGAPNTAHDIASFSAVVSPISVTFVADFYNPVAPPSAFSLRSVTGFIDIDLDQDPLTGATAKKSLFSPAGDSQLVYCINQT